MPTLDAYVTRTELGLSNLDIGDSATGYGVPVGRVEPGAVSWRRQLVRSPFVDGASEVGRVKDLAEGQLVVEVQDASFATQQTLLAALLAAFSQSYYELHLVYDTAAYAWSCLSADYSVAFDEEFEHGTLAKVTLTFPRQPLAVAGPV